MTILSAVAIGWAISRYGYDAVLAGSWLTMRWLTGLVGLVGVAVVMSYPLRKQVYRRRAARCYWMLAHVYELLRVWCCCFIQAREPVDC